MDFDKDGCEKLEHAWISGEKEIGLSIHGVAYVVNLTLFTQTNAKTNKQRMIRRIDLDPHTNAMRVWGRGPVWEWESTHDVFVPYPPETSDEIERRFSRDELTASIKLPISAHESADFLIHFGHMWQENRETKQHRRIRRSVMDLLELPKPALSAGVPTQKRAREGVDGNISARSSPPSLEQWKMVDSVMVLHRVPTAGTIKVAGFDMDDTLVYPKSGAVFAKSKSDWQWVSPQVVPKLRELHTEGYTIVVFSNQSGIFGSLKLQIGVVRKLAVAAAEVLFATSKGHNLSACRVSDVHA